MPASPPVQRLDALPRLGPLFARSLLPRPAGPALIPEGTVAVDGITQDRDRLAAYARVCGFTLRDRVPPTWLHVLAFPLHVHLLAGPESTIRLVGVVHVANRMRLHRPVTASDRLEVSARAECLRPHRRGALLDLVAEVRVDGGLAWEGVSTYLAPGAAVEGTPDDTPSDEWEPREPIATWRLPAGLGRDYRDVSGDPNPIHTSRLAARAFGFARPIIHGMWTHARLLAALEPRLPSTYDVDVAFTRPILLPATVGAWWTPTPDGWRAAVTTRDGARPHLRARVG